MRDLFHLPAGYFLTHSVGCQPKSTPGFVDRVFYKPWQSKGGAAWPQWMESLEAFRERLAQVLGTRTANICPQTNVSSALTKILFSLPAQKGRNVIVLSKQDFPTIGFVFKQAQTMGYRLRFIDGDLSDIKTWRSALRDDVAIVHITHALSNTSELLPVAALCTLARHRGIINIVDIAQSVGIVPIDLLDWDFDFVIGTSVKYLCGGPGACFLAASERMIDRARPIDVGWFSHENPFEMDIEHFKYARDAMKFFGGTPSPLPFITSLNAINLWADIGIQSINQSVQSKLDTLVNAVDEAALVSPSARAKRGGALVLAPKDRDEFREKIQAQGFLFDERAQGFRFSVHAYTPNDDIERLAAQLKLLS